MDPNTNLTVQNFTNASNAKVDGLEAELSSSPIKGLDLSLSTSLLDATYRNFSSSGTDYSGNRLPNAPRVTLTAAARYEHPLFGGDALASIDANYRAKVFYDTTNVERLTDTERTFVNMRLGWKTSDQHIEFGLWGRNIFNETNISDIIPIEGLGFDLFSMGIAANGWRLCAVQLLIGYERNRAPAMDRRQAQPAGLFFLHVRRHQRHHDRWAAAFAARRA